MHNESEIFFNATNNINNMQLKMIYRQIMRYRNETVSTDYNLCEQIRICGHRLQSVGKDKNRRPEI